MNPSPRPRPLFIVGCPRSGTTWTEEMLCQHPKVASKRLESNLHHLVALAQRHPNPRERSQYRAATIEFYRRSALVGYLSEASFNDALERALDSADTAFERAFTLIHGIVEHVLVDVPEGTELFVEKTPQNLFIAEGLLDVFADARLIIVIRDGRDVAVSMKERLRAIPDLYPADLGERARMWKRYADRGLRIASNPRFSARVLSLRYESLIQRPRPVLASAFEFAGLSVDSTLLADIVAATRFPAGLSIGPAAQKRKGIVGDWRNHFSESDLQIFRQCAGDTLAQLGYDS